MESTTLLSTPPDEVDTLIQMVADEAGLQWKEKLDTPAIKRGEAKEEAQAEEVDPANALEKRLAALRNE